MATRTVSNLDASFGFGLQDDFLGDSAFVTANVDWFTHPAARLIMGINESNVPFPLEISGYPTLRSVYKDMLFYGAQAELIPRLDNSFGWLLLGAMGSASSISGKDSSGNSVAGVNTHIFRFNISDLTALPWLAVRRRLGGDTPSGEIGFDCLVDGFEFTMPAAGKLMASFGLVGRDFIKESPSAWTYQNTNEAAERTGESGRGFFKIGTRTPVIMGAAFQLSNGITPPKDQMAIGSFRANDLKSLQRGCIIRGVYKYTDAALDNEVYTGLTNGTAWSSEPLIVETSGANYACDIQFQAPRNIGVTARPYTIRFQANKIALQLDGPMQLDPGGFMVRAFTITLLQPDSGDYARIYLENNQTSYVAP